MSESRLDYLQDVCELDDHERALLRLALNHVADGGIIISTSDGFILTWPDGGVARRKANGHWG